MIPIDDLIQRLERISPMPADKDASEEILTEYENVMDLLSQHNGPFEDRAIQAIVNSFGYGEGFGLYWSAVHLLEKIEHPQLIPMLLRAVEQGSPGSRMWAAFLLGRTRDPSHIPHIVRLLKDDNELVRLHALIILEMLNYSSLFEQSKELLNDPSNEVKSKAKRLIEKLDGRTM